MSAAVQQLGTIRDIAPLNISYAAGLKFRRRAPTTRYPGLLGYLVFPWVVMIEQA
jgi:hypothetical protein